MTPKPSDLIHYPGGHAFTLAAIAAAADLSFAGFNMAVVDGALLVTPASKLTDEHRQTIRLHKMELIGIASYITACEIARRTA